jgi:hypothetical protein
VSAKTTALSLAADLGADLRQVDRELTCEAPARMVWVATDTHELIAAQEWGEPLAACWSQMVSDLRLGLRPCGDADCEWCE